MGTGIGHFIPFLAYAGFWVVALLSIVKDPTYGMYYMIPFLPYRTLRDHFLDWPLGNSVLTMLVLAVILGGLLHGRRLPKSKLYWIWLVAGVYLYLSMWLGSVLTTAPAPLWLDQINFVTWKDYMLIPLVFVAAGLTLRDRTSIRTAVLLAGFTLLMIDRSALMESLSHNWSTFDEDKRGGGPLGYGSNQTAAFLASFALFFWSFNQFVKRKAFKLVSYGTVAATLTATMYCFSRAAYIAVVASVLVLGLLKDRKLLILGVVFLFTWQAVVPEAVKERVNMTHDANGNLEASAQERVDLWNDAEQTFMRYPVFGTGFASFQFGEHVDNLRDTHNWYVKVLVETGLVGLGIFLFMLQQMFAVGWRLFRRARDPMYRGLGLGLFVGLFCLALTNLFGDRWTYLEITGLFWVLLGAALHADRLVKGEQDALPEASEAATPSAAMAYTG